MLDWIISPRMILLPFALGQWVLAWSLRFLPRRDSLSAFLKGVLQIAIAATLLTVILAELFLYKSLTGQDSLRDDNFFFTVMIAQGLVTVALTFSSDSALKRKEREAPPDPTSPDALT
jgi:hypothetical protein